MSVKFAYLMSLFRMRSAVATIFSLS